LRTGSIARTHRVEARNRCSDFSLVGDGRTREKYSRKYNNLGPIFRLRQRDFPSGSSLGLHVLDMPPRSAPKRKPKQSTLDFRRHEPPSVESSKTTKPLSNVSSRFQIKLPRNTSYLFIFGFLVLSATPLFNASELG
jgi:hypothetical protein